MTLFCINQFFHLTTFVSHPHGCSLINKEFCIFTYHRCHIISFFPSLPRWEGFSQFEFHVTYVVQPLSHIDWHFFHSKCDMFQHPAIWFLSIDVSDWSKEMSTIRKKVAQPMNIDTKQEGSLKKTDDLQREHIKTKICIVCK